MILDLPQRPNSIVSSASNETPEELNNNGGFPSLLSDEEFEDLQLRRNQAERSEQDRWDNRGIRAKPVPTDGLPESTIEQRFAHVSKQLVAMWPSEACALYISRLVIDDRGSREGFPQEVIDDLMMLYEINETRCLARAVNQRSEGRTPTSRHTDAPKAGFNWNSINKNGYVPPGSTMEQTKELKSIRGSKGTFFVEQLNLTSDEVMRVGEAETLEDAIAIAKGTIDEYLARYRHYLTSADALYTQYQERGLMLCIVDRQTLNVCDFDCLHYASLQCLRVCKENQAPTIFAASMNGKPGAK